MRVPKRANRATTIFLVCIGIVLICLAGERIAEMRDAGRYPHPGVLIDVGGRRLHILCKGERHGPVVVMIAGGGTPAVVSYVLQDRIARFARVCSYDRPGLGWSDPAPHRLTFPEHADDLERLLRNAHVDPPYIFVPESFGSLIALQFTANHPKEVAGIVFLDGAEPQLWFEAMVGQSRAGADIRAALIHAAWRLGIVRLAYPMLVPSWVGALPPEIKGEMRAIYSRPSAGYAEALEAYRATSVRGRPRVVSGLLGAKPVLAIVHGKSSSDLSAQFEAGWRGSQKRFATLSRNFAIVTATRAGHEVAQEDPELAADTVRKVLTQAWRSDR